MSDDRGPEPPPPYPGRVFDARLHLLDRQVLDRNGVPVTTVDDLEIEDPQGGRPGAHQPRLLALLDGSSLLTRIFGGRPPSSRLLRIRLDTVTKIGIVLELSTEGKDMDVGWTERWLRDRIFRHIPGGRHDPE